ncbi:MAG TPA: RluA family pseudouridine synthase [Saprospiraceae bacterium]|nr:RluA family pseudouridine synthase [Saprospiraceae bacterium]HQW57129.1 RluA family pseudouridine synthase [Saprospiraceae bacterium]
MEVEIIYADDYLLVVNKPAGLLSIPDRFHPEKPNLSHLLGKYSERLYTVHRLDKETSGIICFAKDAKTHAALSQLFQDRQVSKKYLALVSGSNLDAEGTITGELSPDPQFPGRMQVSKKGKKSITNYRVLERFRDSCYTEIEILTGRMHQIRAHFKSIGFPLYIDKIYGTRESIFISDIKQRKLVRFEQDERPPVPLMSRTSLHAWKLGFVHPFKGEYIEFEAILPKDFRATLQQLRKWCSLS